MSRPIDGATHGSSTGQSSFVPLELPSKVGIRLGKLILYRQQHGHKLTLCSSNGANLSFPVYFGIGNGDTPGAPNQIRDQWLVGLINAAPYIGSAFLGVWCSDPLNNLFGRRIVIFISAIFCLLTPIGGALAQSWQQLLVTRLLLGIGMGLKGATVPIFAAENAPARIRGALVMSWQMWTAFGIFLGFIANLVVAGAGKIAWRLQIGSAMIPAIPLVVGIFFCPESPRWLMKKNRYTEAYTSLRVLRFNEIQAARDLYYIHTLLELEASIVGKSSYITRFIQLFTIPRVRRATLASFTVMIAQQMCGKFQQGVPRKELRLTC